ncbi:HIT family protein [Castellaniella sp.]|uniref:HIT family protein n=1 Tax=Castellaniella sp. TaxID=1955812 RepID=UPI003C73BFA3
MDTVFTRILAGEIPAAIVYRDDTFFAFMDAGQLNPGHVLVAPCHPYPTLLDMDEDTAAGLMRLAWRVAHAVQEAFQPEGLTLLQANRPAGWQTVPHAHMHVLPRYENDGVGLVWPRKDPGLDVLREYAARIHLPVQGLLPASK